ncbi:MAG: transposase [bacterium]
MPRTARIVIPDVKHHVTQRGNNRAQVFFEDADYLKYLELLAKHAAKYQVTVHGYCLMPNHVHIVLTPHHEKALALAVGRTNFRYTQYINMSKNRSGHLWQNRFFSCALDDEHYWTALRYVERNPVRAQMINSAIDYRWSSASAHIAGIDNTGMLDLVSWQNEIPANIWRERLFSPEEEMEIMMLRNTTHTGRPLGNEEFIIEYESKLGKRLSALPVGRPKKKIDKIDKIDK